MLSGPRSFQLSKLPASPRPSSLTASSTPLWIGAHDAARFSERSAHYHLSLEFNIRQLVLSDLAESVGQAKGEAAKAEDVVAAIDLITSRVETRVPSPCAEKIDGLPTVQPTSQVPDGLPQENGEGLKHPERVFMVCTSATFTHWLPLTHYVVKRTSSMQHRLRRTRH